jgi:hypothetical protein
MSGMFLRTGKVDLREADWNKLEKLIKEKYGVSYAKRNVLSAKVEWYNRLANFVAYTRTALDYLNKYYSIQDDNDAYRVNYYAWDAFKYSNDKKVIDGFIKWMAKAVQRKPDYPLLLDTYAQLLYKAGKTDAALYWEGKAIEASIGVYEPRKKSYQSTLEKMKEGQPTYGAF